jgi:hypothetical protein
MEYTLHDFTGFERTFEFSVQKDGKWHEYKCYADYHIVYNVYEDNYTLKLDKATVSLYNSEFEKYISYSMTDEEFNALQKSMNDYAHWQDVIEWFESYTDKD